MELKAVDTDPDRSLKVCGALGAEEKGFLEQEDTYFEVPRGRLKLRRENDAVPCLIAYERANEAGARESRFRIAEVGDDRHLEAALSSVLDIQVVVPKVRQLFLWEGVRIHLDKVEDLGRFIEFEAVVSPEDADYAQHERKLRALRRAFGIEDANLIGESYCDLVLATTNSDPIVERSFPPVQRCE